MITLHTDGASKGNPGLGGYAAILQYNEHIKELVGAFDKTTNNRMELMAVIVGLEAIKKPNQRVIVYTDSSYIVNAINKEWLKRWLKNNLKTKSGKDRRNSDLWRRFWAVYQKHSTSFRWVQGHAGNPINERCDQLAVRAAKKGPWLQDHGYLARK